MAAADVPPPEPEQAIQPCVVETINVDGFPVAAHRWCVWSVDHWVPLMGPEGQAQVFGIRPGVVPPPPIPKHQRRLE